MEKSTYGESGFIYYHPEKNITVIIRLGWNYAEVTYDAKLKGRCPVEKHIKNYIELEAAGWAYMGEL